MKWMGKRYSNPLSWLVWLLFEMPTVLVAVIFQWCGRGFHAVANLWMRHVYYVFVRLARWIDRKPGWREADWMIGVPPPDFKDRAAKAEITPLCEVDAWFKKSVERGKEILHGTNPTTGEPWSLKDLEHLSADDRSAIANALVGAATISPVSVVEES